MIITRSDKKMILNNRSLFWDVDPETIDLERNANFVIERFLEYGTLEGIRWLRAKYGDVRIRDFVFTKRFRIRSKKTLNYWRIIFNISLEEWNKPYSRIPSASS